MTALTRTNRLCVSRAIAFGDGRLAAAGRAVEEQRTKTILRDEPRQQAAGL